MLLTAESHHHFIVCVVFVQCQSQVYLKDTLMPLAVFNAHVCARSWPNVCPAGTINVYFLAACSLGTVRIISSQMSPPLWGACVRCAKLGGVRRDAASGGGSEGGRRRSPPDHCSLSVAGV